MTPIDHLDFTTLTPAQRRYVIRRYDGQSDDESIATIKALARLGWIYPNSQTLTRLAVKAYEYWLTWGDVEELPGGTQWVGGRKISKSFLQKLIKAQIAALSSGWERETI